MADYKASNARDENLHNETHSARSVGSLEELIARIDAETLSREGSPEGHPEFDQLVRTIWRLRQEDGCPWDREQTHSSIVRNLIEEAYEAAETIQAADTIHLREELGDLLMQVLLHAQIAADANEFSLSDCVSELNRKLVRRHPHVFGSVEAGTAEEALASWDSIKAKERSTDASDSAAGLLDSIPTGMPALMQAQKVSVRAAKAGFEWETVADIWDKIDEERSEFAAEDPNSAAAELEFGDILFALVNVARREGIDAELALQKSTLKFRMRWSLLEAEVTKQGRTVEELSAQELNEVWESVKEAL